MVTEKELYLMADNEVSKLVWVAIVVALAAAIYFIAKPQIDTIAANVFKKVSDLVSSIKFSNPVVTP